LLYIFTGRKDGGGPSAGLVFDGKGNLYGTTVAGGNMHGSRCNPGGCGTVFEMSPSSGGWTETVLYRFTGGKDGWAPLSDVTLDAHGNLYGTTFWGGKAPDCGTGCGVVFEISHSKIGWKEAVIHWFTDKNGDGKGPSGGLVLDRTGNLYGTAWVGGSSSECTEGCGILFKLTRSKHGWKEKIVHEFGSYSGDAANPPAT